jgi:hypothetical protein
MLNTSPEFVIMDAVLTWDTLDKELGTRSNMGALLRVRKLADTTPMGGPQCASHLVPGGAINEHDKEAPALREACQTELVWSLGPLWCWRGTRRSP